jgi:hypothetical protein
MAEKERDLRALAASLSDLERSLVFGTNERWGSWMFMVGSDLVAKGLGRRDGRGSIYFDTPLADALRASSPQEGNDQ